MSLLLLMLLLLMLLLKKEHSLSKAAGFERRGLRRKSNSADWKTAREGIPNGC